VRLRLRKVVDLSLTDKPVEVAHLTVEEEKLHLQIDNIAKDVRAILETARQGLTSEKTVGADLKRRWIIRFLREAPAIVGSNMEVYGPFEAEDVAALPSENAEGLIKHGVGKRIDVP